MEITIKDLPALITAIHNVRNGTNFSDKMFNEYTETLKGMCSKLKNMSFESESSNHYIEVLANGTISNTDFSNIPAGEYKLVKV